MVLKKESVVDFEKLFGKVSFDCNNKLDEFVAKDFGDFILFGVKEKDKK